MQQGSSRASTTFGMAVAAATGVTSLVAHGIGSAMLPSSVQVLCLLVACVALAAVARPMPRRTGPFAALMVAGQLVAHLALSLGGVMTAVSATSGQAGPTGGMGHGSAAVAAAPMNHPHAGPMALAHLVGTVFAVLLVHGILAIVASARRALSSLLARLAACAHPAWCRAALCGARSSSGGGAGRSRRHCAAHRSRSSRPRCPDLLLRRCASIRAAVARRRRVHVVEASCRATPSWRHRHGSAVVTLTPLRRPAEGSEVIDEGLGCAGSRADSLH